MILFRIRGTDVECPWEEDGLMLQLGGSVYLKMAESRYGSLGGLYAYHGPRDRFLKDLPEYRKVDKSDIEIVIPPSDAIEEVLRGEMEKWGKRDCMETHVSNVGYTGIKRLQGGLTNPTADQEHWLAVWDEACERVKDAVT